MAALQQFGEDIWIVDGPSVRFMVADLPTRMIVVKLGDGALWLNSPVTVSPETLAQINAIGNVRYLVAPTPLHVWRLEQGQETFPQAQLWGPPKVPRSADFQYAGLLRDGPPAAWASDIDQLVFKGNALIKEVEFFHKKSRTLIVTDFVQNYKASSDDMLSNFVNRAGGVLGGGVPLDIRLCITKRDLARRSLEKLLAWDFDRLIVAHGECVEHDAKAFMRHCFRWLLRS